MDYNKIKEEISKMKPVIKNILIVDLLMSKSINYIDISNAYSKCLENESIKNKIEKRLIVGCLATKYQGEEEDIEYNNARSMLLIDPYVPEGFIDKYFKNVSKEAIEKEKKFLKRKIDNKDKCEYKTKWEE